MLSLAALGLDRVAAEKEILTHNASTAPLSCPNSYLFLFRSAHQIKILDQLLQELLFFKIVLFYFSRND